MTPKHKHSIKFRHSIALRYLGIAIAFLVIVELLFGAFEIYRGFVEHKADLETKVSNHAKFLSAVSAETIISLDFLTLERLMQHTAADPDIVYSVILNVEGRPLTRFLDRQDPIVARHLKNDRSPQQILAQVSQDPEIRELRWPIASESVLVGEIQLGYSLRNVQDSLVKSTISTIAGVFAVSIVLAGLTIILFNREVRQPLQDLADLAQALAAGELHKRACGPENDEIGQLKRSFNRMASQLQTTMTGWEQQAIELKLLLRELQHTQSQLIHAEKMSALGQMVAGIAHEFNNPISFIYGNVEYADQYLTDLLDLLHFYQQSSTTLPPHIQEKIEQIDLDFIAQDFPKILNSMKIGADRIRKLVESLRTFSRLDESELKAVNLYEAIECTLVMLNRRLSSQIELVKNYGNVPRIECYAAELTQVFMHILNNAIDALIDSDSNIQQNATIHIITKQISPHRIQVKIRDNGPGIEPDILDKIFNPFFTTKPVGSGTGLGLAVSYQILEHHQGELFCISTVGEGTEFTIELPIHQPQKKIEKPGAIDFM